MQHLRNAIMACLIGLSLAATVHAGSSRADSPGAILGARHRDIAGCIQSKGQVKLLLRLVLDGEARVKVVEIESENSLSKKCRTCIEGKVSDLQFGLDLAGQVIEHEMVVVNSGNKPRR
jgi:hypothetical protein